ncbi:PQQ-binding-like beta-propeller repeat protein [Stieleria sp. ICT_E10.1]|uniref:outer membrane protein assembly factor BamB family protein n=1 Tax=Stieleria sedimenti TaxID=2976331 RepID=UPI0021806BBC|nr:PQQ-binding-like beta-propeller repeat protein [Stieleria sedimenti]MCS7470403.1 PQQ-binding-like beta-propeller repeat protein [Stieleria sedimenti]
MHARLCILAACLSLALSSSHADSTWPQFRGPGGDGIVTDQHTPLTFGEKENLAWKTELPGKAWSSPVIDDGVVWATTAIEVFPSEEERLDLLRAAGIEEKKFKQLAVAKAIRLKLFALDLESGRQLADIDLTEVETPDPIHSLNSYASPTPVIDGPNIYCHFGTYGTFCVNRDSRQIEWQRQLPLDHSVGPGSSPFIDGQRLILIQDGIERQYVTALDKSTGKTLWETDRPEMDAPTGDQKKAYCTPIKITDRLGREQLICMGSQWMVAYEPATGNEIWKVRHGKGFSVVPRPVYADGIVYFSTGFGKPQLWAVKVDGSGDVSHTHVAWTVMKGIPAKPSPILHDGLIYVMEDNGIASCFEAESGDEVWKKRIGGKYSASPLLVGDRIYLGSHEGTVTVISTGRDSEVLAENQLDGQIMASPAVVDNSLIVRTADAIYRFQE